MRIPLRRPVDACRMIRLLAVFAIAAIPALAPAAMGKVALQLKWRHQFQFAGYYVAAQMGYYRDAGIDVEIREANPDMNFTDEVVQGRAQYGINNTDLLIDRVEGKKVVVLAVIFQHSPDILLSLAKSGLSSPKDFIGKRVMLTPGTEAEIYSMFANESVPTSAIDFIPHSWNIEDLVSGRVDAVSAYTTNESLVLKARGIRINEVRPLTYGIDFYGDCLFTSEAELHAHPARAAAFLAASLKGWDWAMDHVEETCDLILDKYPSGKDKASLMAEAAAMDEIMVHKFVPIGVMNPGRWRHVGDTYAKLGAIPADYSLDGFLYDPKAPTVDPRTLKLVITILTAAMAASVAYILILRTFNSRLEIEVASRTAGIEELNRALSAEVQERKEKEKLIAISLGEKEVLLKEVHHRVRNNLQVIASIINMQIAGTGDFRIHDMLKTLRSRVFSMALVHERLYGGDSISRIDMDEYLRTLVEEIVMAYQRPGLAMATEVEARGIVFAAERAMPIGLIVGEIVSNSMKHAFNDRAAGRVEVRLRRAGPGYELRISDDGTGLSREAASRANDARDGGGIGFLLVDALASQLGGKLNREAGEGLTYLLAFA
jgi:two-component sensor histidine kinase/ABC-type nitrate/sulfonate/bicarbonate transport system substrate-binding protein